MAIRNIVKEGDPILNKVCRPVTNFDVAGGGAKHPEGQVRLLRGLTAQEGREPGGGPGHLDLLRAGEAHDAEPAEGRVEAQPAVGDLLLEEGVVVLGGGEVEDGVVGVGGLDDGCLLYTSRCV